MARPRTRKAIKSDGKWKHGTIVGYYAKGCGCGKCRAAGLKYARDRKRRPRELVMHGTLSGYYNDGCRCPQCTSFASRYSKAWRRQQVTPAMITAAVKAVTPSTSRSEAAKMLKAALAVRYPLPVARNADGVCPQGHDISQPHLLNSQGGCKECKNARARKNWLKRQQAAGRNPKVRKP